jgi:hypothetical protein
MRRCIDDSQWCSKGGGGAVLCTQRLGLWQAHTQVTIMRAAAAMRRFVTPGGALVQQGWWASGALGSAAGTLASTRTGEHGSLHFEGQ